MMKFYELGQPLNALVCFTEGLTNSVSQRPASKAVTEADLCVIAGITRQAQRAKDVLNRVRSYAKGKSDRSQSVNLAPVIGKVVRDLHLRTVPGLSLRLNNPRLKARGFLTRCRLSRNSQGFWLFVHSCG